MKLDPIVHHTTKAPDGSNYAYKVTRTTPITRIGCMGQVVLLQGGHFFSEGGDELTELPGWLHDEMSKMPPLALKEAGFDKVPDLDGHVTAKSETPTLLSCPHCGKLVEPDAMKEHLTKHNRKLGVNEQLPDFKTPVTKSKTFTASEAQDKATDAQNKASSAQNKATAAQDKASDIQRKN